jgi:hypothetical protein
MKDDFARRSIRRLLACPSVCLSAPHESESDSFVANKTRCVENHLNAMEGYIRPDEEDLEVLPCARPSGLGSEEQFGRPDIDGTELGPKGRTELLLEEHLVRVSVR